MEESRLAMQKRADSGLPGPFCSRWQENNPLSVLSGGFVQRVPKWRTLRWWVDQRAKIHARDAE